jgi:hypothetical protein
MFAQHTASFGIKVEQMVIESRLEGLLHLSLKREITRPVLQYRQFLQGGLRR